VSSNIKQLLVQSILISWDGVYEEELANFEELGDEGEIWCVLTALGSYHLSLWNRFGIETVERMVAWAQENVPPTTNPSVLEIGCGNGTLVLALFEAGYAATHLSGIDYSPGAIKLARSIATTRGEEITFNYCDFLQEDPPALSHMKEGVWDLLLDKGTFDAIALGEKDESGRSPAVNYPGRVQKLLAPGGCFLITCTCMPRVFKSCNIMIVHLGLACNFTETELKAQFTTSETGLVYQ
jgi:EEF1A lysine methyltransferase 2